MNPVQGQMGSVIDSGWASGAVVRWVKPLPQLVAAPMMPDSPVALDVGTERANAGTVLADLRFVATDDISRRAIAAIQVQPVAVALQTKLFLAEMFLIGAQICS
jgi:hypothetical protein